MKIADKCTLQSFKDNITKFGRIIDAQIFYDPPNAVNEVEVSSDKILSINLHYNGDILKTVMQQLDINVKENIPIDAGLYVRFQVYGEYYLPWWKFFDDVYRDGIEYYKYEDNEFTLLVKGVDYNVGELIDEEDNICRKKTEYYDLYSKIFTIYKSEYQAETDSYKLTCYDQMLSTMGPYEGIHTYNLTEDTEFVENKVYYVPSFNWYEEYTGQRTGNPSALELYEYSDLRFPITIRDYLIELCRFLEYGLANYNETFPNYDKVLTHDLFLDENGKPLGYTFRDVLDQLAQATASTICCSKIYSNELELRYITDTEDTIDETFLKDINVGFGKKYGPINSIVLSRSAESDNIYKQDAESIALNGLCELKIVDNQIMNENDRDSYLNDIFNQLNGLEYYINDYSSTGILYYDLCDKYSVKIGENTYPCIMFNDEIILTQGLRENVHTDMPSTNETEYKSSSESDRNFNKAYLIVRKVEGEIEGLVSKTQEIDTSLNNNYQELKEKFNGYAPTSRVVEIENSVREIQTDTYTKTEINTKLIDGSVQKVQTASATFDESGMTYRKTNSEVETTINEVGVKTKKISNNKTILFAGYVDENNSEFSDYEGQTIVATDNIIVQNYLVVGTHSRLEDYESGTGCFYIG